MLAENLARVQQRIRQACERRGRDPSSVTLVCVTKGIPVETIREVVALGAAELGENRVQEAGAKIAALSGVVRPAEGMQTSAGVRDVAPRRGGMSGPVGLPVGLRWHLIGHLQRNKSKDAAELFDAIHSVDSPALAEALERHTARKGQETGGKGQGREPIELFVQVNVSGEATKFGCRPEEAFDLADRIRQCPHLRLRGLMTIAPFVENPESVRPYFRRLRELRDEIQAYLSLTPLAPCPSPLHLSMGMSQDFEVAIEEGADLVRIGTAIFKGQGAGDAGQGK